MNINEITPQQLKAYLHQQAAQRIHAESLRLHQDANHPTVKLAAECLAAATDLWEHLKNSRSDSRLKVLSEYSHHSAPSYEFRADKGQGKAVSA